MLTIAQQLDVRADGLNAIISDATLDIAVELPLDYRRDNLFRPLFRASRLLPAAAPTCSACGRSVNVCIGDDMCGPAAKGFSNTSGAPAKHCRPLLPYREPGLTLFGLRDKDYRAEALSRDPMLSCTIERMCGSWGLAYVVRTRGGYHITHNESERGAWAGASGATLNSRYNAEVRDRPRKALDSFAADDRALFARYRPLMSDQAEREAERRALGGQS